ncbi:MAG: PQQ-dependent sugar dehydrogenase [Ginsengibacter sp.]
MKKLHFHFITLVSVIGLIACGTQARKPHENLKSARIDSIGVRFEMITNAIEAPIEMDVSPDNTNRNFITDNAGKIWILKNDSLLAKPFFNIYDKLGEQDKKSKIGSIFSMAFHPQFSTNRKFYVCYNAPSKMHENICKLVVSEFTASKTNPDVADLTTEYPVLELEGKNSKDNGAQIAFGPEGYLYISIGDNKGSDTSYKYRAQNLHFLNGKLLRIDINKTPYAIPADNPFVTTKSARPEIWAYGFRKMWHFCFEPGTHQLFGADVGEEKEEEIDIVTKGANYGWPAKEGDSSFEKSVLNNASAYTSPINAYTHKDGICVIGGNFYYGKDIPLLSNKYVFADFNGSLFALMKNAQGNWTRQPLKVHNRPADPLIICGCNVDGNNDIFVMGFLNTKSGNKGAVYKIVKG